MSQLPAAIIAEDLQALAEAKALLEHPGLAARISGVIGTPIERGFAALPDRVARTITQISHKAIAKALDVAVGTLDAAKAGNPAANGWHKLTVGASGALGGAFGLAALAVELPFSTTVMLRSIADIARSQGADLTDPQVRLECLQVLALGGRSPDDDASEAGYFTSRAALAQAVNAAARHVSQQGLAGSSAPAMVKLITEVAARFSITVSEKAMAQAVPVVGALGGAAINTVFIGHFQDMGRGHFTVRRLERQYGEALVRSAYEML